MAIQLFAGFALLVVFGFIASSQEDEDERRLGPDTTKDIDEDVPTLAGGLRTAAATPSGPEATVETLEVVESAAQRLEAHVPLAFFDAEVFEEDEPEFDPTQLMDASEIAEIIGNVQPNPHRRKVFRPSSNN